MATFGLLFSLLIGYELFASVMHEGIAVYHSLKHGVEARGIPAALMYTAMLGLGGLLTAYGVRGALRT